MAKSKSAKLEEKDEPKKKATRPRVTKARKQLEKDKEKIDKLFGNLIKNTELENKILTVDNSINDLRVFDPQEDGEKIKNSINSQIDQLDAKLKTIDSEFQQVMKELGEIEEFKNKLQLDQISINSLIEKEQNSIIYWEGKLEKLDMNHFTADRAALTRFIFRIFGIQDEIYLRQQIARSETIISQWNTKLVEIKSLLSKVLIACKGYQQVVDTISGLKESYRSIRLNLGKIRREIKVKIKEQRNSEEQQAIMENYIENIDKLKQIGSEFSNSTSRNGEFIAKMFQEIQLNRGNLFYNRSLDQVEIENSKEEENL